MKKIKSKKIGFIPKKIKSKPNESLMISGSNNNSFVLNLILNDLVKVPEVIAVWPNLEEFNEILKKATDLAMNNFNFSNFQFDLHVFSNVLEHEFADLNPEEKFVFIKIIFPKITEKLINASALKPIDNLTVRSIVEAIYLFSSEFNSLKKLIEERVNKPFLINEVDQNAFLINLSAQCFCLGLNEYQMYVMNSFVRITFCADLEDFVTH